MRVRTLCPVLVGRDRELALVESLLDSAGATLVICGEPGIGKTRLAREAVAAAKARGMTTLVGRGLQHGQAPFRPLTEALFAAARAGALPADPSLVPFRRALGTIVPDWREDGAAEESAVILGEGVLRLARVLGGDAGTLLVVDDLHWADSDTLEVLEYLADNLPGQPVVLLLTQRTQEGLAADDLVSRLENRGAATVLALDRLDPAEVVAMAAACTDGVQLPDGVVEAVRDRAEGVPLFVEELLSVPASGISQAVPTNFAEAVARRVRAMSAEAILVVECAAALGRRFDWRLLAPVTALDEVRVQRGLADAVAVQLLATDADGEFRFRHALTRDAVLAGMLPPTRVALVRRAAQAVVDPVLAADLWVAAGDPETAARGLVAAGRLALGRGALVTAERLLERARSLQVDDRTDVAVALAETLALAAKVDAALEVGAEALQLLERAGAPPDRRARLHLVLARAADAATRWSLADEHVNRARALARDERLLTTVDGLAAHIAFGELRYDDAAELATAVADRAVGLELPEVACEALEVLGRRERQRDLRAAEAVFERAHRIARDADLTLWSIRALHELGTIDMLERLSATRLLEASELAHRAGALSVAATVDLQLQGLYGYLFELDAAVAAGHRAVAAAGALGLTEVHAAAWFQLGFAHALAGRRTEMEDAVQAGLRVGGESPELQAWAWGHARAMASIVTEDRARALEELDTALGWARQVPGITGSFTALHALLRVVGGADAEAIDEIRGFAAQAIPVNQAIVAMAEAVLAGRTGAVDTARKRMADADAILVPQLTVWGHLTRRYVAEAALADGWGDPQRWLSDAMLFFEGSGHDRIAAACRDLLRSAGHRVPRAAGAEMPAELRRAGVSARELDVLRLLGDRLSNKEIAERLYLSPRTVEKHVERLLGKTAVADRTALGRLARTTLGRDT